MTPTQKPSSASAQELRQIFDEFVKKYKALETEKDKLISDFLRQTDEAITQKLIADLQDKTK